MKFTIATAATVAIITTDSVGLSALSPVIAGIIAGIIGVIVGTVPWQLITNQPIREFKAIIGYVLIAIAIVFITQDISPDDILQMTGSPKAASFWRSSIAFRYAIISFFLTQMHLVPHITKKLLKK